MQSPLPPTSPQTPAPSPTPSLDEPDHTALDPKYYKLVCARGRKLTSACWSVVHELVGHPAMDKGYNHVCVYELCEGKCAAARTRVDPHPP